MSLDYTIHHRDVRVRLAATATRPPGRGRTWTVEAGHWHAEGATETAATAALAERLQQFLTQYQDPKVLSFRGFIAVLTLDLGDDYRPVSWHDHLIHPNGRGIVSSSFTADGWDDAQARTRYNLAQLSTDWHDDSSVHEAAAYLDDRRGVAGSEYGPAELYRYAAWQRAAAAAMAAGRDDWHQWAHEHQAQFAVPPSTETDRPQHGT